MNVYLFAAFLVAWTFLFLLLVHLSRQQRRIGRDVRVFLDRDQTISLIKSEASPRPESD